MLSQIDAVVIIYNPEIKMFNRMLESIRIQVRHIYLINNGCTDFNPENKQITQVNLGENKGIAYAQNVGIRMAIQGKADFVLLSDQDTIYPPDYIKKMMSAYLELKQKYKIAAIAPAFIDSHKKEEKQPFLKFNKSKLVKFYPLSGWFEVSYVIASGKIIPLNVIDEIGLMDEKLFIDWVDVEWCWRAQSMNYKILQCAEISIEHCLGDDTTLLLGRKVTTRNAVRYYYMIRNALYLMKNYFYLDYYKRKFLLLRTFRSVIVYSIISTKKLKVIKYMLKGIKDAFTLKMGKINIR